MISCTRIYVESTETRKGQRRKRVLVRNGQICRSHSSKLALSITINLLSQSRLISVESASLEEQDPESETDNFGCSSLEDTTVNWVVSCDER